MPRGVYRRKKKFPATSLRQLRQLEYSVPTAKERTDSKKHMFIQQIISSIQNQLNLLREITNG